MRKTIKSISKLNFKKVMDLKEAISSFYLSLYILKHFFHDYITKETEAEINNNKLNIKEQQQTISKNIQINDYLKNLFTNTSITLKKIYVYFEKICKTIQNIYYTKKRIGTPNQSNNNYLIEDTKLIIKKLIVYEAIGKSIKFLESNNDHKDKLKIFNFVNDNFKIFEEFCEIV